MFLVVFLIMFVATQMFTREIPVWLRAVFGASFLVSLVMVYSFIRGWDRAFELSFIPVALYGGAIGLLAIGWVWDRIAGRISTSYAART